MDDRKKTILFTIVKEHIKSGAPVGSNYIVEKYELNISPATVRNEMADLEDMGFIAQPHTSAGRIPTEKAYHLFLENIKSSELSGQEQEIFTGLLDAKDALNLKKAAKELSRITGQTVFWAFARNNLYYTGISNLLQQPEFSQFKYLCSISQVIDQMDDIVDRIFNKIQPGVEIKIGSQNPFSDICASIIGRYKTKDQNGMFGILGPLRMDYEKNLGLVKEINQLMLR